jgi:hypothetical protein
MPAIDDTRRLPVSEIAQHTVMPAWQVAELFGVPESEVEAEYGDPVRVARTLTSVTLLPPSDSSEEG